MFYLKLFLMVAIRKLFQLSILDSPISNVSLFYVYKILSFYAM